MGEAGFLGLEVRKDIETKKSSGNRESTCLAGKGERFQMKIWISWVL